MRKYHSAVVLGALLTLASVLGHMEFSRTACLAIHNELRALHQDTGSVVYDMDLEKSANSTAGILFSQDSFEVDKRPTRPLPKRRRRRRHADDVDENLHIESWDGEIFFPEAKFPSEEYGQSIHKMCCTTAPHCPREFFHGLLFPPSAEGVVNDFYKEEIGSYDFSSGQKKTQYYTQIKHFTNIVWKETTRIGCSQTKVTGKNCVYTIVHYKVKGSPDDGSPDLYKTNVRDLIVAGGSRVLTIFLIAFFIVLLLLMLVLCFCCRDRIREKYYEVKIKTDTMKAEQELDTDSTSFWWMRVFQKRRKPQRAPAHGRSTKHHQSLRDSKISIEVVHTAKPQRSFKQPPRVRGQSNAQSFALRYQGIGRKAKTYRPDESIYENTQPLQQKLKQIEDNDGEIYENSAFHNKPIPPMPPAYKPVVTREPSFSGKPPPPAVPTPHFNFATKPPVLKQQQQQQQQKPPKANKPVVPSNRPPTNTNGARLPPSKPLAQQHGAPLTAPRPTPRPSAASRTTESFNEGQNNSPSVNEIRNKFNQSSGGKATPPVKAKPMLPPGHRPR